MHGAEGSHCTCQARQCTPIAHTLATICHSNPCSSQWSLEIDSSDVLYLAVGGDGVKKMSTAGADISSWASSALGNCDVRHIAFDGSGLLHMGEIRCPDCMPSTHCTVQAVVGYSNCKQFALRFSGGPPLRSHSNANS